MRIPGIPYVQGKNDYTDVDGLHYGIAIHNTSNDASDEGEANWAARRPDGVSSHFYVDKDSVTQSLDTNDKAGHAGSHTGNNNAIAFEITGANGKSAEWWKANVDWDALAYVIAYLVLHDPDYRGFQFRRASVTEMRNNPRVRAFYGHNDMRQAWGGTTHTDPGPNFPWDTLIAVCQAKYNEMTTVEDDDMPSAQEVATSVWDDMAREYVDEDGDLVRESRTRSDILHAAHANAIYAKRAAEAALEIAKSNETKLNEILALLKTPTEA